ncbi:MAG: hypothetical protein E4H20_07425 [Spirochaetales bacterium]|nr:MAG: hypothetical protein E4H20_07425 [Spirochaetales bacterium]
MAFAQEKQSILVAPLTSESLSPEERRLVSDAVISRIMESQRFVVVSEESRQLAFEEIERSNSAVFTESKALVAGRMIHVDLVLILSAGILGEGRAWATARLVDANTGRLVGVASQEFTSFEGLSGRMRLLSGKALGLDDGEVQMIASDEYILVSPSGYQIFEALTASVPIYAVNAAAHDFTSLSASLGIHASYGRPLGFFLGVSVLVPFSVELDGIAQDWLFDFSFPWGVDIAIGASWTHGISDSLIIVALGGLHMVELQYYQPWSIGWDAVEERLGPDEFWFIQWNVGCFLGLDTYIALNKKWYLLVSCVVAYDFQELLPNIVPVDYALKGAWSIMPIIALAHGK